MIQILKKIISLALVTAMAVCSLTSCTVDYARAKKKANKALEEKKYTVEVDLDFECRDSEASGIFEQLEAAKTKLYFKYGDFKSENTLSIDYGDGKNTFTTVYTVIGHVIYSNMSYYTDGTAQREVKAKALISEEESDIFAGKLCFIGELSGADFGESTKGKLDGEQFIVYAAPLDSAKVILEEAMAKQLEGASEGVELVDARMTVEIEDGKYDTVTVECTYSVTLQGKAYTVDAEIELDFDFDESLEINYPADQDSYGDTALENIIG